MAGSSSTRPVARLKLHYSSHHTTITMFKKEYVWLTSGFHIKVSAIELEYRLTPQQYHPGLQVQGQVLHLARPAPTTHNHVPTPHTLHRRGDAQERAARCHESVRPSPHPQTHGPLPATSAISPRILHTHQARANLACTVTAQPSTS